jgi:Zn-dependent M28 family amino/carboxypeptidase
MTRRPLIRSTVLLCALAAGAGAQGPVRSAAADFVAPGPVVPVAGHIMDAVAGLRAERIASHMALLSSPALEGRGLSSSGLEAAAEYVAAQLALAGVGPMRRAEGPGSPAAPYFHPVPIRQISRASCRVRVEWRQEAALVERTFAGGVDAVCPEVQPGALSAPAAFAGYGIREARPARDDYRGLDLKGKVAVLYAGLPTGAEWKRPELQERYAAESSRRRFAAKARLAAEAGAVAVLAIEGPEYASAIASGADAPAPVYYLPDEPDDEAGIPVVRMSEAAGRALVAADGGSGTPGTQASRELTGATMTLTFTGDEQLVPSRNVIGMIPGSDPALAREAVVIGAHFDHLGRSGGTVHPGADDNASGTAALLEIAKAFAAGGRAPRRTVIFAFWTGEEEGHLGSAHYVRSPVWPLDRTPVYLNLDMIAHPWTAAELRTLVTDAKLERRDQFLAAVKPADFIELGVADSAPELATVLAQAARATGLALHLDWTDGKSGGSDYRAFARRGRPFVRFFGNYFDGYHEPTDTIDKLDPGQVLKMARLALAAAWLFADQ